MEENSSPVAAGAAAKEENESFNPGTQTKAEREKKEAAETAVKKYEDGAEPLGKANEGCQGIGGDNGAAGATGQSTKRPGNSGHGAKVDTKKIARAREEMKYSLKPFFAQCEPEPYDFTEINM